jgi:hypothetical protein
MEHINMPVNQFDARRRTKEENPYEFYLTPPDDSQKAMLNLTADFPVDYPVRILDPGAGNGSWGYAARRIWPNAIITAVEPFCFVAFQPTEYVDNAADYRPYYDNWLTVDYLYMYAPTEEFDIITGNPPFSSEKCIPWINKSLALIQPKGVVNFMLRSSFAQGQYRYTLHMAHRPRKITFLSRRPKFGKNKMGKMGTDMVDYSVFEWDKTPALQCIADWRY